MNLKEQIIWIAILLFISPFVVYFVPQFLGMNAHIVDSGSMRPTLPPGTVLFDHPVDTSTLEEGDVIVFHPNDSRMSADRVAHRIVDIRQGNYTMQFKTMGDANREPDPGWTPSYKVSGKRAFAIPYLGTVITTFKSRPMILLVVALPSAILIRKEFIKLLDSLEEDEPEPREREPDNTIYFREKPRNQDTE